MRRLALAALDRMPWPVILALGAVVLTAYDVAAATLRRST